MNDLLFIETSYAQGDYIEIINAVIVMIIIVEKTLNNQIGFQIKATYTRSKYQNPQTSQRFRFV